MKYPMSLMSLGLLAVSLTASPTALANPPLSHITSQTASTGLSSDAELDSLLAPVALYPDTLLTHILIASTYPLDIVAADRWRQANSHLSPAQVEQALRHEHWDPSVKALTPFSDILALMADDLSWLSALGNAVRLDQSRVLDRVQQLRRYAHTQGTLRSNSYLQITRSAQVIAIVPRHHTQLYVPFYDTRHVFGHWHHRIAPVYWRYPLHARRYAGVHWSTGITLSASFYFGSIHWQHRYVAISHQPVRHWRPTHKRVHSQAFQRWQHRQRAHTTPVKRVITRQLTTAGASSHRVSKHRTATGIMPSRTNTPTSVQRANSKVIKQQQVRDVEPVRAVGKADTPTVRHHPRSRAQHLRPVKGITARKQERPERHSKPHRVMRAKQAKPQHHR